ncbi:hypothetical protein [Chamaesiphon minutus]|uniref:PQQ enzyme repeat-containing protein n=1 Tax=Chamaesiphon minutus (strain ATCC 27169 / PCC 6605) TaxID=1173020 RepID=K9ULG2_CHAP6|nr:hypothetical protein [Chamaesiphon minutus]AFY95039.1 hypothetical protein Cha6605_4085 [Chamaesiphon minutus PCC 6605]
MSDSEQIRPLFLPGGVLSPDGQIGYFTNSNNSIEAIDLNDGKTLWTNEVASYPLMATSNWLVAQKSIPDRVNGFEIAKLDLERYGSLLWVSAPIVFPDWVCVYRDATLNFQVRATTENLFLDWQAQNYYRGGAAPPPDLLRQIDRQRDRGTVQIALNSGEIEMLPSEATTDASIAEELPPGAWIAGQKIVHLTSGNIEGQQGVQLRLRDRSGDRSGFDIIELGRGKTLDYLVTLDGCYILVCPDVYADVEQPWWIFAAETGQLVTTVKYDVGDRAMMIRSISIFNSKIYYLVDRRIDPLAHQSLLRVQDLNSGKLCWEYEIEPPQIAQPNLP